MNIEKVKYPDGTFYPLIDLTTIYGKDLIQYLTYRINSYEDLWFLKQIKDGLDHNKIKCGLIIPCLLDAQADRRFQGNSSANLKLICNFINDMKWDKVSIYHPHNQEVVEALIDDVQIVDNSEFIMRVLNQLGANPILQEKYHIKGQPNNYDNLIIMSLDAGGYKPLMKLADKIGWKGETYSASKARKWLNGESTITQTLDRQDFGGKDILIIDDLLIGGGSVIGLAKMLKERNCGKLYVAVSHITVNNPNPELFKTFDKVFTTNSKGYNYDCKSERIDNHIEMAIPKNLQIINLF